LVQMALAVQGDQRAVWAIHAEELFQALDFGQGLVEQAPGGARVGAVEPQFGVGAERDAAPLRGGRGAGGAGRAQAGGDQGPGGDGGGDAEEAAAGADGWVHGVDPDESGAGAGGGAS